jgi:cold shock protein
MQVGTLIRFDDIRGYGFIEPADGTEDVFVHANDFGDSRHMVHSGLLVHFEATQSDRGPKVTSVSLVGPEATSAPVPAAAPPAPVTRVAQPEPRSSALSQGEDDDLCDVLSAKEISCAITDLLIEHVPTLTGAHIADIRQQFIKFAQSHGWVER